MRPPEAKGNRSEAEVILEPEVVQGSPGANPVRSLRIFERGIYAFWRPTMNFLQAVANECVEKSSL